MKATIKEIEVCMKCRQSSMFIGGMQVICSGDEQCENIEPILPDISEAEKEQMRVVDDEMDDIHCHNSEGCYGQGTYL